MTSPLSKQSPGVLQEISAEVKDLAGGVYTLEGYIGNGSYGEVCAARDLRVDEKVAIKRVFQCSQYGKKKKILDDAFLSKRVLRELMILSHFRHPNILGLHAVLKPGPVLDDKLYLVTDLMMTDLQAIIRSGQLTEAHTQYFLFQILVGLKALHDANVMHRDLHPANILLDLENDIKICDFNLGREEVPEQSDLTDYVTARWYRAPELVMQWQQYSRAVDMWSLGCIAAECYRGTPLFRGTTFYKQLDAIVQVLGLPNEEDVSHIGSSAARRYLFDNPVFHQMKTQPLSYWIPNAHPMALDLVSGLLQFAPSKRLTADQALKHPYFADLYDPADFTDPLATPFTGDSYIEKLETPEHIRTALDQHIDAFMARRREESIQQSEPLSGSTPVSITPSSVQLSNHSTSSSSNSTRSDSSQSVGHLNVDATESLPIGALSLKDQAEEAGADRSAR